MIEIFVTFFDSLFLPQGLCLIESLIEINDFNFSTFWYTLSLIGFITTVLFFMFFKEELAERG